MTASIQNSNKFQLIIQTNSPGELAAWARPLILTCRQDYPDCIITICLVPCQYATGNEASVARSIPGVHEVLTPKQTLLFLCGLHPSPKKADHGAVLCLGGDPIYTQALGFRCGFSRNIYTEHKNKPGWFFNNIFYKHIHGDLMKSRINHYQNQAVDKKQLLTHYHLPDRPYLLLFLGSRPQHFKAYGRFVLETLPLFLETQDTVDILIGIAPTITDDLVELLDLKSFGSRVHCIRGNSLDFMTIASCMVSLPGTNTAEAMYMHLPMATVLPLNRPDLLALDGLLGLMGSLPLLGGFIKRLALAYLRKKTRFVSLPNRIADKPMVPEWISVLDPQKFSDLLVRFVSNKQHLQTIKQDLQSLEHSQSVDQLIIKTIIQN